jgi:hypothetical protein
VSTRKSRRVSIATVAVLCLVGAIALATVRSASGGTGTAKRPSASHVRISPSALAFHDAMLTALLKEHITGAARVLTALKTNDQPALRTALDAWYANAHDIAVFLSSANPRNWPLAEMDQMMKDHLDATTQEAVARHESDWSADVAAYDKVHEQVLMMADMLSNGIIAQFPKRFRH